MRREEARIRRRGDRGLRRDACFLELCNHARYLLQNIFPVGKLYRADSRRRRFDVGRERVSKLEKEFIEQFFLSPQSCFHRQSEIARQSLARRHAAAHADILSCLI